MEELKEKIREYERSLISDLDKVNQAKGNAEIHLLGSYREWETIYKAQINTCEHIMKMIPKQDEYINGAVCVKCGQ